MSEASPATGAETKARDRPLARRKRRVAAAAGPTAVDLEHARMRHLTWCAVGVLLGGVLLLKLGIVGKLIGIALLVLGAIAGRAFVMTLLHSAGRIEVNEDDVTLPRGLCHAKAETLPVSDLRHAYFLRRAVPWTRSGPLLVVETSQGVFSYPRDWFATDSDQRRIAMALNHRLGRL